MGEGCSVCVVGGVHVSKYFAFVDVQMFHEFRLMNLIL